MKQLVQKLLAFLARKILARHKPAVIGITGSVGKSSAKEAIFLVVEQKFSAQRGKKNFNNEIGLPLAIIGSDSPEANIFGWLLVIFKAFALWLLPLKYPQVLILEMGVDRPGDMDYLLSIAKPDIAVFTPVSQSHYEFFKSEEAIAAEKGKLAQALSSEGFLIVNADSSNAAAQAKLSKAKVLSYSNKNTEADVHISKLEELLDGKIETRMEISLRGQLVPAKFRALGQTHLSAVLAAAAVGLALKIEPSLITKGIEEYKPYPSRLNIISGLKQSVIIDDTYNAAPDSMRAALALLAALPAKRKIAVLGDMLELGDISNDSHREIGKIAAGLNLSMLVTVGVHGKLIAEGAANAGYQLNKMLWFPDSDSAERPVEALLEAETLVLVKGSQGARMEKIVRYIMAEPMRAGELVCRQYGKWLET